jgi:hypothetical protein
VSELEYVSEFVPGRPHARGVSVSMELPKGGSWLLIEVMNQRLPEPVVLRETDMIYPIWDGYADPRMVGVQIVGEDDARRVALPEPVSFRKGPPDAR